MVHSCFKTTHIMPVKRNLYVGLSVGRITFYARETNGG